MARGDLIQLRRGTAAEWEDVNPVLAHGEVGAATDVGQIKVGDGSSVWTALPYAGAATLNPDDLASVVETVLAELEPPIDLTVLIANALA